MKNSYTQVKIIKPDDDETKTFDFTYDAFGNTIKQGGLSRMNRYTYSTKEEDLSGLIYFGARYYEPRVGRFITQDPLGFVNGSNLYTYCNNNPINWIDPWGLERKQPWWEDWWKWYLWESVFPGPYGQSISG